MKFAIVWYQWEVFSVKNFKIFFKIFNRFYLKKIDDFFENFWILSLIHQKIKKINDHDGVVCFDISKNETVLWIETDFFLNLLIQPKAGQNVPNPVGSMKTILK